MYFWPFVFCFVLFFGGSGVSTKAISFIGLVLYCLSSTSNTVHCICSFEICLFRSSTHSFGLAWLFLFLNFLILCVF
jgi:hypothetical protein